MFRKVITAMVCGVMAFSLCSCAGNEENSISSGGADVVSSEANSEKVNLSSVYENTKQPFADWYAGESDEDDPTANEALSTILTTVTDTTVALGTSTDADIETLINKALSSPEKLTMNDLNAIMPFMDAYDWALKEAELINKELNLPESLDEALKNDLEEFIHYGTFKPLNNGAEYENPDSGYTVAVTWKQAKNPYQFSITYTIE